MLSLTYPFVSRLGDVSCLFGPLTPDGALPVRLSDRSGGRRLTLLLDIARLRDAEYCDSQLLRIRRSLAA